MPLLADDLRSLAHGLSAAALIIAALVLGRAVLTPFALALVLTFILAPTVKRFVKWRLPRGLGVLLVMTVVVATIILMTTAFSSQLVSLAGGLGSYKANLIEKVRTITGPAASESALRKAIATIESLGTDLKKEIQQPDASPGRPAPTVVVEQRDNGTEVIGVAAFKQAMEPITFIGLTLLFTVFLLLEHRDLRDRLVRLAGTDNMTKTTAALDEAGARLSSLLTMQLVLNAGYGMFVGCALFLIGVPNALLWGTATAILRFVPFIGSILAAVPPVLLAAAVDPGWSMVIATLALFLITEPIMGHLVEPLVLGNRAGLSPLAVVAAASFWTVVWGPIGLILSAPLTVVIVVLGQYVPRFEFMSILLGDAPALTPDEAFYHRLLSGDAEAAFAQFDALRAEKGISDAADLMVLPALRRAASDHRNMRTTAEQVAKVQSAMDVFMDMLSIETAEEAARVNDEGPLVLIVPARGPIDAIAARFLAVVLDAIPSTRAQALQKGSGLMALASARSGKEPPAEILLVTVGGLDTSFTELLRRRAKHDFPDARVHAMDLGASIEKPHGSSERRPPEHEVLVRALLERHTAGQRDRTSKETEVTKVRAAAPAT